MKIYNNINEFTTVDKPVLTIGTFDGIHFGHQKIIQEINEVAKRIGGESVLLTFSPHPRLVLYPDSGLELINTLDERIENLEKAGLKHLIIQEFTKKFSQIEPEEYVKSILVDGIGVNTIIVGYDHKFGQKGAGNYELLKKLSSDNNYSVIELSEKTIKDITISSTKIRNAIKSGDILVANEYLGYKFSFRGVVVKGAGKGSGIGFPTANIEKLDAHKIIPDTGVFAVVVNVKGGEYIGMMNIGFKPTISNKNVKTIEVNIFDFDQDIYRENIKVTIKSKIRDEKRFDSMKELSEQLMQDKIIVREELS